jgi:hypothetical protein
LWGEREREKGKEHTMQNQWSFAWERRGRRQGRRRRSLRGRAPGLRCARVTLNYAME